MTNSNQNVTQSNTASLSVGQTAVVIERSEGDALIKIECSQTKAVSCAKQAVSCMIAPEAGDRVLVQDVDGTPYVLAVLDRTPISDDQETVQPSKYRISVPGELTIEAKKITFRTKVAMFLTESVNMAGRSFRALFEEFARVSKKDTSMAAMSSSRSLNRVDVVDNVDVQRSGTLKQDSEGALAVSSKVALIKAEQDIRIDGERVNLG